MPLDPLARRYADNLFKSVELTIPQNQTQELAEIAGKHSRSGTIRSGSYLTETTNVLVKSIRVMAEAKTHGLLRAYAQSGTPFDDVAFSEVKSEVIEFCSHQQDSTVTVVRRNVRQMFSQPGPSNLEAAATNQVVAGVTDIIAKMVCKLEIERDESILEQRKMTKAYGAGAGKEKDVFISHASEDKDFVRALAEALQKSGLLVWFDEFTLKLGDSLRQKIDEGLAHSRYGIVVLSEAFFAKNWPVLELDGLVSREVAGSVKVILPVWHKISYEQVAKHSPILSGRLAAKSDEGLDIVVKRIRDAMGVTA